MPKRNGCNERSIGKRRVVVDLTFNVLIQGCTCTAIALPHIGVHVLHILVNKNCDGQAVQTKDIRFQL